MSIRRIVRGFLVALLVVSAAGCGNSRSAPSAAAPVATPLSPDTILRLHWQGKKQMSAEASAYYLMRLWQLPESKKLENQTLDKLAVAPWRLLQGNAAAANAPAALLRPLLDDIIQNECYFEVRQPTNAPQELVFAIRLDDERSGLWRTNLVAAIAALTGIQTVEVRDNGQGWALHETKAPQAFELSRVGNWTALGIGPQSNGLFQAALSRIQRDQTPCVPGSTDDWLTADVDFNRLGIASAFSRKLPAGLPKMTLTATGDGAHVLTHAKFNFPKALPDAIRDWTIPTNLIHPPLNSFTAARGLEPWLSEWPQWAALNIGEPPGQIYFWSRTNGNYESYFAAPFADASNRVQRIAERLLRDANPWLAAHGYVSFEPLSGLNGVAWGRLPNIRPFIESVSAESHGFILGGLVPESDSAGGPPQPQLYYHPSFPDLLDQMKSQTNLVRFHWELTGPQINNLLYVGDFLRLISRKAQLPLESASATWLSVLVPRGGNCETLVTRTGANQLTMERKSMLGLSAAELHLLADWLESPGFPLGLHSFVAPPQTPGRPGPPVRPH